MNAKAKFRNLGMSHLKKVHAFSLLAEYCGIF